MGGDLRVDRWVWRCGWAAVVFVALAVLPAAAEPQPIPLAEARAEAELAERELDAARKRAHELTERARDPAFAHQMTDGESFRRFEQEIADTRAGLAAAERNLHDRTTRLVALEALAEGIAERKRLREEFAARTRELEVSKSRAAKTRASIRHADAERKRLTARLGTLEQKVASAKSPTRKSASQLKSRSRAPQAKALKTAKKSRATISSATKRRHQQATRSRPDRHARRDRASR